MSDEGQSASGAGLIDQLLRIGRVFRQLARVAKDQQMVAAFPEGLIVDFFTDHHQELVAALLDVTIHFLHQDVMIRYEQGIQAGPQPGLGQLGMRAVSI